jgi:dimethylargininase
MLTAITRSVSRGIGRCELEFLERQEIDVEKAEAQHRQYLAALAAMGARVIALAPEHDLPDAVFVEDPAIVLDEVAVMTRMARESRRGESASLAKAISGFRPLRQIHEPATLEGGDVLRVGRVLYVGVSARTNAGGIARLAEELAPLGYSVKPVEVRGCLHLKSAVCYLGNGTLLANREWFDAAALDGFETIDVAPDEPRAANVLAIGDSVLIPASFPATGRRLEDRGWKVEALNTSELMKAEAGVTCMSLVFESGTGAQEDRSLAVAAR